MRASRGILGLAMLVAGLLATAEQSFAQSPIQRMFSPHGSSTPIFSYSRVNPYGSVGVRYENDWRPKDRTTYRTMCVRLCDGFYFPISFGVLRGSFYRDNRACMKRCDGKVRLFYYPSAGASIENMIDLSGRAYRSLPNAFRYRKALVAGCTCRAAPWSAEEETRHSEYALAEAERELAELQTEKRGGGPASAVSEAREIKPLQSYRTGLSRFSRAQTPRRSFNGWSPSWWRRHD